MTITLSEESMLGHSGNLPTDLNARRFWAKNLAFLELFQPRTAALLSLEAPPGRPGLIKKEEKGLSYGNKQGESVKIRDPALHTTLSDPNAVWVAMGCGEGERIRQLLETTKNKIIVIEPEAALLQYFFAQGDYTKAIQQGRLEAHIPNLTHFSASEVNLHELCTRLQQALSVHHVLNWLATGSTQLNKSLYDAVQTATHFTVSITNRYPPQKVKQEAVWRYDVTVISPMCAIFDDIAQTLAQLGLRVQLYRIPDDHRDWNDTRWEKAVNDLRMEPSKYILCRNRSLLETINPRRRFNFETILPGEIRSWWWDVPNISTMIDQQQSSCKKPAFAFARDILKLLPEGSIWLPAAARSQFCIAGGADQPVLKTDLDITFVGQSRFSLVYRNLNVIADALTLFGGRDEQSLGKALSTQRNIEQIYTLLCEHRSALKAWCKRFQLIQPSYSYYLDYLIEMVRTAAFRILAIKRVADHGLPITVFGDEEWLSEGVVKRAQYGGLIAPDQLPQVYMRSKVNLNLNFMQVSSTVNPKVLDMAACNSVVLTDYRPELDDLYAESNCRPFSFHDFDELLNKAEFLLNEPLSEYKQRLGQFTRRHHSMRTRVTQLASKFELL